MSDHPTLAQEWQDYFQSCYPGETDPKAIAEIRLTFYSGWYACMSALSKLPTTEPGVALEVLNGWGKEFETLARRYLKERRGEGANK